ncbi:uncharacterized protein LOC128277601 [Anopheles cruzii]|uniref:uncharacterized protein LOC128277601 n=1 Tax=Anopheles cruzii TaxID=68878 RepID=UPI0022EC51E9|nr:uncharacterized protein LOC128277601 [Anopheles cruzii]
MIRGTGLLLPLGVLLVVLIQPSVAKPREFNSSDLETLDSPAFLADIRQQCRNATGNDQSYQELQGYISTVLPQCFMQHVNMEQLKTDTTNLEDKEKRQVFQRICAQINESLVCLTPVMEKLKPCLDGEDVKIMEQVVATIPEALGMACTNSGALLQNFTQPAYRSCAMELPPMIEECTGDLPESMKHVPFSQYSDDQCDEIYGMRDCFSKRINDCGATAYMDFFILFYRKLLALTPCK